MTFRIPCIILILFLCWNCAQQGTPTGGPRDEDPPVVVECEPPNYSTGFTARKVAITFDEYIVLESVNQELIVSPPLENKPEVRLRKKTLIIELEGDLRDSTTYTLNFGSAIQDLHEGNKLLNYEYVFSTGDVLDSMSVKGTLKYAEDLTAPDEPVSIMLYDDLRDSVPLIDIPLYVGKSDDSGVFSVNNLKSGLYKVFALKDGNNNLLFDLPTEEIAFLDTSLIVNAEFSRSILEAADTLRSMKDSLQAMQDSPGPEPDTTHALSPPEIRGFAQTDSIKADSLKEAGPDLNSIYIDLMLFTEETDIQYLTDYSRDDPREIRMSFARPLTDSFRYHFLIPGEGDVEYLEYFSPEKDSLTLWILDSIDFKRDTLGIGIDFTTKDTTNRFVTTTDTLLFTYRKRNAGRRRGAEETGETVEVEKLQVKTIRNNGEIDLNKEIRIDTDLPLKGLNDSLIRLYHMVDTVEAETVFRTHIDSALLTRAWLETEWEPASGYRLFLLPGALQSWYPTDHDTMNISFRTRDNEYYGRILLSLENVHDRILVQLISQDKVVLERTLSNPGLITFPYLSPRDYRIKFVHDINGNGKWDTGKYLEGRQPEPVEFLPAKITVRSNWDHDVTMVLRKQVR